MVCPGLCFFLFACHCLHPSRHSTLVVWAWQWQDHKKGYDTQVGGGRGQECWLCLPSSSEMSFHSSSLLRITSGTSVIRAELRAWWLEVDEMRRGRPIPTFSKGRWARGKRWELGCQRRHSIHFHRKWKFPFLSMPPSFQKLLQSFLQPHEKF